MTDLAVKARFHDYRRVGTKSVFHLIFEIPIEQADAALKCLGGTPQPGREQWVGIAPIRDLGESKSGTSPSPGRADGARGAPPPARMQTPVVTTAHPAPSAAPKSPGDIARVDCIMKCKDRRFQDYIIHEAMKREIVIGECGEREDECVRLTKLLLGIESRAEIGKNDIVRAKWRKLEAQYLEHAKLLPEQRG